MLLVLLRYFRSHGAGDSVASAHIVGEVNADLAAARECKGFGVQAGRGCKCVFEAELKWLVLIGGKINTRRSSLRLPRWNSSRTLNTASGGIDDYDRLITVLVHSFYGLPSLMTVAIVGRRGGSRLPILGLLIDPGRSCVVPLLVVGTTRVDKQTKDGETTTTTTTYDGNGHETGKTIEGVDKDGNKTIIIIDPSTGGVKSSTTVPAGKPKTAPPRIDLPPDEYKPFKLSLKYTF